MLAPEELQGKTPEELRQFLEDNSSGSEQMMVKRYFTDEELEQMRVEMTDNSILRYDKQEELKDLTSGLRREIKNYSTLIAEKLKLLKDKYEEQREEVFLLDDQIGGMMYYYAADGTLVSSRKLLPKERQMRIRPTFKTN